MTYRRTLDVKEATSFGRQDMDGLMQEVLHTQGIQISENMF